MLNWIARNRTVLTSNAGALGDAEHPFIAIAPKSTLARRGSTWYGPIYGLNRTKLHTYAKLNCFDN